MLNTDQHSPQIKSRMSKHEFVSNNRGINDGRDLDPQLLSDVFDQIVSDEIKLQDDPLASRVHQHSGSSAVFSLWGSSASNKIREQHAHASASMAAKSEQSIRSMARARRRQWDRQRGAAGDGDVGGAVDDEDALDGWGAVQLGAADYLRATRADHIAPMFGAVWTGVLAALSLPMQTSADPHVVAACLAGFQCGIALACRFRMALERTTFVTTLRNFTQLQNLAEMRRKHVEAIRALVEVAASRPDVGDGLDGSWMDVLQCVSQLERLQLLTQGSESTAVAAARSRGSRASADASSVFAGVLSVSGPPPAEQSIPARTFFGPAAAAAAAAPGSPSSPTSPPAASAAGGAQGPPVSVAELAKLETNSQVLVVTVDRLFTASVHLSGAGIVDFVRALSQVAWGELTASFAAS
ncbi:guanine nucleotide exchange protein for ADP-robosylation factor, partial [Coemansia nantahalensis]